MEDPQFERLLHEIAQSRHHTDEIAMTLRDEMQRGNAETVALLRDEMRRSTAETVARLSERIDSTAEDSRRHFGVVAESLRHDDRLLAEGFATLDAKIDRVGADLRTEIVETRAMVKLSYAELDRRPRTLEGARAQ